MLPIPCHEESLTPISLFLGKWLAKNYLMRKYTFKQIKFILPYIIKTNFMNMLLHSSNQNNYEK